jgi:ankyrin repeat protein
MESAAGYRDTDMNVIHVSVANAFILSPQRGNTALHYASEKGHPEVIQILVQSHADVNVKNNVSTESPH